MRIIVALLFTATLLCGSIRAVETRGATDHCDHIPVFEKIFETIKVRTLLEFGLGFSTQYFLDACTKVISVEFISTAWGTDWIKTWLNFYQGCSNWVPVVYFSNFNGDISWAPYKYRGSIAIETG